MLITAPIICWGFIFSLNMMAEGQIIKTGTRDIKVEAIPVFICWIANKDKATPINGPKKNLPSLISYRFCF